LRKTALFERVLVEFGGILKNAEKVLRKIAFFLRKIAFF
jgi:hypothetical protein